jgi:hypothetical protein
MKNRGKDSSPSEDDSSERHPAIAVEEHTQNQTGLHYSAHITSVCEALNAEGGGSMSPFEEVMLKKRRETNRLSARNRRKRRGDEINLLLEEQRRLNLESKQLVAEKAKLQAELHHEVSMTPSLAVNNNTHVQLSEQPQINPAQMLHNILLQQQRQHTLLVPNLALTVNPSMALFAHLMSTSSYIDSTSLEAQISGDPFTTTKHSSLVPSLDMFELLSRLQASQGSVATPPSIQPTWIGSQTPTATASAPVSTTSARVPAHALLENRHERSTFYTDEELDRIANHINSSSERKPRARETDAKHP